TCALNRHVCNYFPTKLVKTSDLNPMYLFCNFSHGILCTEVRNAFRTDITGYNELSPTIQILDEDSSSRTYSDNTSNVAVPSYFVCHISTSVLICKSSSCETGILMKSVELNPLQKRLKYDTEKRAGHLISTTEDSLKYFGNCNRLASVTEPQHPLFTYNSLI
ncbi:unnamed protein product, partial [Heterotrigona itama]